MANSMEKKPSINRNKSSSQHQKLKRALRFFDDKKFSKAKKILTELKLQQNNNFSLNRHLFTQPYKLIPNY